MSEEYKISFAFVHVLVYQITHLSYGLKVGTESLTHSLPADHFLRVSFVDENFQPLRLSDQSMIDHSLSPMSRIVEVLNQGTTLLVVQ